MPRFPAFYDTGRPSKYHKSCSFCDFVIPRVQNISKPPKTGLFEIREEGINISNAYENGSLKYGGGKNISNLKNTPNLQKSTFGMQSEVKMHPKSRIRAIWDTFAPEKVSQKVAKPPAQILARITNIFPYLPKTRRATKKRHSRNECRDCAAISYFRRL